MGNRMFTCSYCNEGAILYSAIGKSYCKYHMETKYFNSHSEVT